MIDARSYGGEVHLSADVGVGVLELAHGLMRYGRRGGLDFADVEDGQIRIRFRSGAASPDASSHFVAARSEVHAEIGVSGAALIRALADARGRHIQSAHLAGGWVVFGLRRPHLAGRVVRPGGARRMNPPAPEPAGP